MDISGRIAVVTGASSGIGAAVATDLARRGATVVAVARRKDKLDEIIETCRQHAPASMACPADVSSRGECEGVIATADERFGRVDIVVNNAGISIHRNAARTTSDDVERLMAVNFFAAVYLTNAAMPGMLERGSGAVVNVTSVAGYVPNPGEAAYGASKAALLNSNPASPWKSFEPLLVITLITPPVAPPYSASKPALLTWTSCTNSSGSALFCGRKPLTFSFTSTPSTT